MAQLRFLSLSFIHFEQMYHGMALVSEYLIGRAWTQNAEYLCWSMAQVLLPSFSFIHFEKIYHEMALVSEYLSCRARTQNAEYPSWSMGQVRFPFFSFIYCEKLYYGRDLCLISSLVKHKYRTRNVQAELWRRYHFSLSVIFIAFSLKKAK